MKKIILILAACLLLPACSRSLDSGIDAYKEKQYEKAQEIFVKYAEDPVAQFYLYKIFYNGRGVPKNEKRALAYLKQSAEKGYAEAQEELASMYQNGKGGLSKDMNEALRLYTEAAAKGRKSASLQIGRYYDSSDGGSNWKEALQYYLQAAGSVRGDWELADIYAYRDGVPQNPKLSFDYMQAIARAKGAEEEINLEYFKFVLAEYYYYGFGTQKDNAEAVNILASIKDKSDDAKAFYAWLLFWGEGIKADPAEAVRIWLPLLEKALNKQQKYNSSPVSLNTYAFHGLAIAFTNGRGVAANPFQAALFRKGNKISRSFPFGPDDWLQLKYNALGYLDNECRSDAFIGRKGSYGRYKSLYAETLVAVSKCIHKNKTSPRNQVDAFKMAKEASILGNADAIELAAEQWKNMSDEDRTAYRNEEKWVASANQVFRLGLGNEAGVRIGMTKAEALDSNWGWPERINKTINVNGVREQWGYGGKNYLYFENGVLTTIQN